MPNQRRGQSFISVALPEVSFASSHTERPENTKISNFREDLCKTKGKARHTRLELILARYQVTSSFYGFVIDTRTAQCSSHVDCQQRLFSYTIQRKAAIDMQLLPVWNSDRSVPSPTCTRNARPGTPIWGLIYGDHCGGYTVTLLFFSCPFFFRPVFFLRNFRQLFYMLFTVVFEKLFGRSFSADPWNPCQMKLAELSPQKGEGMEKPLSRSRASHSFFQWSISSLNGLDSMTERTQGLCQGAPRSKNALHPKLIKYYQILSSNFCPMDTVAQHMLLKKKSSSLIWLDGRCINSGRPTGSKLQVLHSFTMLKYYTNSS